MWDVVKQMLTSKKFLAALLSIVVWVAGRLGWSVDYETLLGVVTPLWGFILAQALADHGKEAAAIKADSQAAIADTAWKRVSDKQAGRINAEMLAGIVTTAIGVIALCAMLLGCGAAVRYQVVFDAEQCGKAEVAGAAADLVVDVVSILEHGTGAWRDELDAIEAQGKAHGGAALLCSVRAAVGDLARAAAARVGTGVVLDTPEAAGAARGREYLAGYAKPDLTLPIKKEQ
jgi:hypothetical protein